MEHLKEWWCLYILASPVMLWFLYLITWMIMGTFCEDCSKKYNYWWTEKYWQKVEKEG